MSTIFQMINVCIANKNNLNKNKNKNNNKDFIAHLFAKQRKKKAAKDELC